MKSSIFPGYKYKDGSYVCLNCAGIPENKESLLSRGEREIVFLSELSEKRVPKCTLCHTSMNMITMNDEMPRKRGRPLKKEETEEAEEPATVEVIAVEATSALEATVPVKRGRGRPKGSKNKPKQE